MTTPITSDRELYRQDFASRLPKDLSEPYIMNTMKTPLTYVAFYPALRHEMADGRIVNGNELRILRYETGFKPQKMLGAIIGIQENPVCLVLLALADTGTKAGDLKPFETMIREMMGEMVRTNG